jgi:hypothetical protein
VRVIASASPSRSASTANVVLLRAPFGLPGLPGRNGRPRVFLAFLRGSLMLSLRRWALGGFLPAAALPYEECNVLWVSGPPPAGSPLLFPLELLVSCDHNRVNAPVLFAVCSN